MVLHQPWYNSAAAPDWSAPARSPSALRDRASVRCTAAAAAAAASDIDSLVREGSYPECRLADERKDRCTRQRDRCKLYRAACKLIAAHTAVAKAWCKPACATGPFLEQAVAVVGRTRVSSAAGWSSSSIDPGMCTPLLSTPEISTRGEWNGIDKEPTGWNRC